MIIDDDFLLSQYPTSINWNLDLLGKNSTENKTAYKKLEKEVIELGKLCHKPLTDARRFMILSHLSLLDQNFNKKESVTNSPNLPLGDEIIKYINDHFQENIQVDDMLHLLCYFLRNTYCSNIDLNKKWTTKKARIHITRILALIIFSTN